MDFATPLCIAGGREGSAEDEETEREREGEREENRRREKEAEEEEEWEGRRGANAEGCVWQRRLSANGSLEKRRSRTIYILSMRQNYIIAHTRNHTAHTQD